MTGHLDAPLRGTPWEENSLKGILLETDILVNCTPIGMSPDIEEAPVPLDLLEPRHVVFDTVYNPMETKLLKEARNRGCRTISGLHMFIHQAAAQFEWWTGKTPPLRVMEEKARERLGS
jgi:3-dehydroquinate dehydratase/shikimate dehydrogenase